MTDPTPGISKAVTAGGTTLIAGEIAGVLDPIIQHAWPWLATPEVMQSISSLVVAGIAFLATYFVPHQIAPGGAP